jgi:hypothetical protein
VSDGGQRTPLGVFLVGEGSLHQKIATKDPQTLAGLAPHPPRLFGAGQISERRINEITYPEAYQDQPPIELLGLFSFNTESLWTLHQDGKAPVYT